jgi:hypothetical protein
MNYWEIMADNLSKAGWSWSYCSAVTPNGTSNVRHERQPTERRSRLLDVRSMERLAVIQSMLREEGGNSRAARVRLFRPHLMRRTLDDHSFRLGQ